MISTSALIAYKVCEFWPKNKITVIEYSYCLSILKHINNRNQIYSNLSQRNSCSNSTTENKNINSSRHCSVTLKCCVNLVVFQSPNMTTYSQKHPNFFFSDDGKVLSAIKIIQWENDDDDLRMDPSDITTWTRKWP